MPNVAAQDLERSRRFYADFLGLQESMRESSFLMLSSSTNPTAEMTVCTTDEWGFDPANAQTHLGIEVPDVDAAYADANERGLNIVRELRTEPWGVRRFFVEDPDGNIVNVLGHP